MLRITTGTRLALVAAATFHIVTLAHGGPGPGNDQCGNAQPITGQGPFFFDNGAATTDGQPDPLCDAFGSQQMDNDVWFCWTAECDGDVTVSTCDLTGVDTKIAAYGDCFCPTGPAIACNDDTCGLQSSMSFPASAGQQYMLRIGTFPGVAGGPGEFRIQCPLDVPILDLQVRQLSFVMPDGTVEQLFSDYGQLHLTVPQPQPGQLLWVNALIDGQHRIQNAPLMMVDAPGQPQLYIYDFRLTDLPGQPVPDVEVKIEITELQLQSVDPFNVQTVPVFEHIYSPGAGLAEPYDSALPRTLPPAQDFINPPDPITWQRCILSGVPGITEDTNHCTPGGFARILDWITHYWCISLPDNNNDVQEFYTKLRNSEHMNTDADDGTRLWGRGFGGTIDCASDSWGKMRAGLVKFIADKGLGDKLSFECNVFTSQDADNPAFTPCDVFDALKQGKAVAINWSWWDNQTTTDHTKRNGGHTISVVGAVKCGENVTIYYRDDVNGNDRQGDTNADSGVKVAKFEPGGATGWTLQGNRWEGFVTICPSFDAMIDAIIKELIESEGRAFQVEQELQGGQTPDAELLCEILELACKIEKLTCELLEAIQHQESPSPEALQLAQRLKEKAIVLKGLAQFLKDDPSENTVQQMLNMIQQMLQQLEQLRGVLTPPCPGDTNGDGVVDVNDLNAVILDWGTDGSANGGDLTGSLPGSPPDGIVDVNDLNDVIVNWGICS